MKFTDCIEIVGSKPSVYEGTKHYVSTGAVEEYFINKNSIEEYTYKERPSRADLVGKDGDILFAKMAETKKTIIIDKKTENYLFSTGFFAIRPRNGVITTKCLYYLLNSKTFLSQKDINSSGATQKAITNTGLEKINVNIPLLSKQDSLVKQFDLLTNIINNFHKQLEKYDTLIKSRFIEMFGDLVKNTKNWKIKNFTKCAEIDTNMVKDFEKYADYPHIGIDSIEKETGILSGYRTVKEDNVISGKYLFTPEHIIYSKIRPNLNKVAMPNFEGLCSADAYPILVKKNIATREYITYVMRSDFFVSYILAFSRRANMPKVNKEQVESFDLPVPPLDLQNQFASFVQQIDKSKFAVQKSLEKAETLYKSLMQEYFG